MRKIIRATELLTRIAMVVCVVGIVIFAWPVSGWAVLIIGVSSLVRKRVHRLTSLGSARWATKKDLQSAGMLGAKSGMILGRLPSESKSKKWRTGGSNCSELIRLTNATHTAVFAPTSAGKGVSLVVPTLLTCEESIVAVDFKGELAAITAEHRRKQFGHRTVLLDPYRIVTQQPDSFNPLDWISANHPLAIDDSFDLANSLVVRTGNEKEPHWNDSAENFISAIISVVVAFGEGSERSLHTVREILSSPQKLDMAIKLMVQSTAWGGAMVPMGGALMHYVDKEKSSVLSTALRHLRFLSTPAISQCTRTSTFDPSELRKGKLSVFLILPPDRAHSQAGLLRMWIGSLLGSCFKGGIQ